MRFLLLKSGAFLLHRWHTCVTQEIQSCLQPCYELGMHAYQLKCFFLQARIIFTYIYIHAFIFLVMTLNSASVRVLWTQNWSVSIFPFHEWNLGQIKAIFRLSEGLGSSFGVCLPTSPQCRMWGWVGCVMTQQSDPPRLSGPAHTSQTLSQSSLSPQCGGTAHESVPGGFHCFREALLRAAAVPWPALGSSSMLA